MKPYYWVCWQEGCMLFLHRTKAEKHEILLEYLGFTVSVIPSEGSEMPVWDEEHQSYRLVSYEEEGAEEAQCQREDSLAKRHINRNIKSMDPTVVF